MKPRGWLILVLAVAVVAGVAFWASHHSTQSNIDQTIKDLTPVTVTYKVHGSASSADLTYATSSGSAQQSGLRIPLTRKSDGADGIEVKLQHGTTAYLSAQNDGDSGDITCIIEVNGRELTRNTSSGGYTIATCQASV